MTHLRCVSMYETWSYFSPHLLSPLSYRIGLELPAGHKSFFHIPLSSERKRGEKRLFACITSLRTQNGGAVLVMHFGLWIHNHWYDRAMHSRYSQLRSAYVCHCKRVVKGWWWRWLCSNREKAIFWSMCRRTICFDPVCNGGTIISE